MQTRHDAAAAITDSAQYETPGCFSLAKEDGEGAIAPAAFSGAITIAWKLWSIRGESHV
jgi:hypothetical protein